MIVYDIEIVKGILGKNDKPVEGIEYCDGWQDHENMGISVICAYDYNADSYRVFCEDNFDKFQQLVDDTDIVVGFNSISFDNQVCAAHNINVPVEKSYDLLVEIWKAVGLGPAFSYPSHVGYGLDAVCAINFGINKTGHGAQAPVDWQQGRIGSVIDYCLADVRLTTALMDAVLNEQPIKNPKNVSQQLLLRNPYEMAVDAG